jgi:hypothetical protein
VLILTNVQTPQAQPPSANAPHVPHSCACYIASLAHQAGGRACDGHAGESARTAKNDVSLKETASIPPPVAHSRVKTQDVPGPRRSTDRRRSIDVACPMRGALGARDADARDGRGRDRGYMYGRDAQRRERERELISLRPQCMCAQARVGREGVGLLVRWSWHVVVDVSLSLSSLVVCWSLSFFSCVGAQMG